MVRILPSAGPDSRMPRLRRRIVPLLGLLTLAACDGARQDALEEPADTVIAAGVSALGLSPVGCEEQQGLQPGAAWPMVGGCAGRAGQARMSGPLAATANWSADLKREVRTSAAVAADGTIYVASDDDSLFALTSRGQIKCQFDLGAADRAPLMPRLPLPARSSPTLGADGTIYVGSDHRPASRDPPDGQGDLVVQDEGSRTLVAHHRAGRNDLLRIDRRGPLTPSKPMERSSGSFSHSRRGQTPTSRGARRSTTRAMCTLPSPTASYPSAREASFATRPLAGPTLGSRLHPRSVGW